MPSTDSLTEAERVMTFCNACRYCEGYCAVFPAMELRRAFSERDLNYLANLCHNCRDCYYACQYAPPHEFALNVPKTLAELRLETYRKYCWPGIFKGLFRRNGLTVALIAALGIVAILVLTIFLQGPATVFTTHTGENAFYKIVPYAFIVGPSSVIALLILVSFFIGICKFWSETGGKPGELGDMRAHIQALGDAMRLRYLDGGGHGCNYPDEGFSMARKWLHHLVFYGFMLCFASTTIAGIYDHFLHLSAPYPILSWPVVFGASGGVALLIGTGGLLYLKLRMDSIPATPRAFGMDISFLVLLFCTSLTGLLLLALRETTLMGTLLAVHLGFVVGLFITMPYGKFIHMLYRYAALVKNAIEQSGGSGF
jgi:citrate/tricarballylate utilization protein